MVTDKVFSQELSNQTQPKYFKITNTTYQNNHQSNYTEKIDLLNHNFDYKNNQDCYWGNSEFSLFYGTPLYQEASQSQKLALNHLYWATQYNHVASNEASTTIYNQITAGVFEKIKNYETLCEEIKLETEQEKYHINAFQRISYKIKLAILGKDYLYESVPKINQYARIHPSLLNKDWLNSDFSKRSYQLLRVLGKQIFKDKTQYYSTYLQDIEKHKKFLKDASHGGYGLAIPKLLLPIIATFWGSSPFLACHHYSFRLSGNMYLKNFELDYYKYHKKLKKQDRFVPIPTAISYYHFLDESFHTTISRTIAKDISQSFSSPTVYEKLIANWITYRLQCGSMSGLSGCIPTVFRNDTFFIHIYYKILRSSLFEMSKKEALYWIEKCCCQEHEGFYLNLHFHKNLLSEQQKFYSQLDYLNATNKEMKVMAAGASINKAIKSNTKSLDKFTSLL